MAPDLPRILFLFSDTGGGHRSAAEAVIEALELEYADRVRTEMVDVFKDYAPRPLNRLPDLYPKIVRLPQAWGLGYRLSDGRRRTRLISGGAWPYVRRAIRRLIATHPSDLIVSMHPLMNGTVLRALGKQHPAFITVVTDMVTAHAFWYSRQVDLCLVPTEEARQRALSLGLRPEQVQVVGLPVAERFCRPIGDRNALRARFGWPQDRALILLVGGGEGMGPLEQVACAISSARLPVSLVVITGRNQQLKQRLESRRWPMPTYIYGFVREMPDFMRAADILVTKAGPGTISEALIAGLPMALYSRLPGQEDGNVSYVVSHAAGVWAPKTEQVVAAIQDWLEHPGRYDRAVMACKHLARPEAARNIARILVERLNRSLLDEQEERDIGKQASPVFQHPAQFL
ncbi:MAG: galactosyldiacylglycerol synthase [Anaerolineales bacterium]|nr:galactosyldiacylglycerol synthase [Anaerolineales bacterium]